MYNISQRVYLPVHYITLPGFFATRLVLSFEVLLVAVIVLAAAAVFRGRFFATHFFRVQAALTANILPVCSVVLRVLQVQVRLRDCAAVLTLVLLRAATAADLLLTAEFDLTTDFARRFTATARVPAL